MCKVVVLFALSICTAAVASAQVDTSIVPREGRTTWAPGLQGGIPARTTVCATLKASDFGNGRQEASAAIQATINVVPARSHGGTLCGHVPHEPLCGAEQGCHPSGRRTGTDDACEDERRARQRLPPGGCLADHHRGTEPMAEDRQHDVGQPHGRCGAGRELRHRYQTPRGSRRVNSCCSTKTTTALRHGRSCRIDSGPR